MASKVIHAIYDDDDILLNAVKAVRDEHYHIEEIYTPFPVHGLEKAMGMADTRIAICSFLYGLVGLVVSIVMIDYMMIRDWPQNIGGKPSFSFIENMPAFVPIMFELTVFFAAHLMVMTFYMRSKLWPFKKAENPDVRTTDDHFLMAIDSGEHDVAKVSNFLTDTGAIEINLIDNEGDN
jgi:Alternative complex III, ActD subunit